MRARRWLLIGLRNNIRPDVAFETQFLAVVAGQARSAWMVVPVAPVDLDRLVASINSGLKIEFGASQEEVKRPFPIRMFFDSSICSLTLS